jgi:hypothetical protein
MSSVNSEKKPLGSFRVWLWIRLVQLVLVALVLFGSAWNWMTLAFLVLITVVSAEMPISYGYATREGLVFRTYFKRHFVPWSGVAGVEQKSVFHGIKIKLKRRTLWRTRALLFEDNPTVTRALNELVGRVQPDTVVWVQKQIDDSIRRGGQD